MNKNSLVWLCLTGVILLILSIYSFYINVFPLKYSQIVFINAEKYQVDSALVFAIIKAESNFVDRAESKVGAKGVMQLMDDTARYVAGIYDIDIKEKDYLFNVGTNIELGCAYLNYLFNKFDNIKYMICAYNAGEGRVSAWIDEKIISENNFQNIPFEETKTYLNKVLFNYSNYINRLKDK